MCFGQNTRRVAQGYQRMQGGGLTMQNEECLKLVAESDASFKKQIEELEKQKRISRQRILDQWAKANTRFKVGDIIQSNDNIIKVTGFYGVYSLYNVDKLYVTYRGIRLTKALKPRKDGSTMALYDDGRKIIKLV